MNRIKLVAVVLIGLLGFGLVPHNASAAYTASDYYPANYTLTGVDNKLSDALIQSHVDANKNLYNYVRYYTFQTEYDGGTHTNLMVMFLTADADITFSIPENSNADRRVFMSSTGTGSGQTITARWNGSAYVLDTVVTDGVNIGQQDDPINDTHKAKTLPVLLENKLMNPEPPAWDGIKITEITASSAKVSWSPAMATSKTGYKLRVNGTALQSDLVFTVGADTNEYRLTGLKENSNYNVYLSTMNGSYTGAEKVKSFRTLDSRFSLSPAIGNMVLMRNASTMIPQGQETDLIVQSNGYIKFDLYVNGNLAGSYDGLSGSESTNIPLATWKVGDSAEYFLEFKAYKTLSNMVNETYAVTISDGTSNHEWDDKGGLKPQPPDKPTSGWDLIGWLEYVVGWIVYIVEVVIYFLGQAGDYISILFIKTQNLATVITNFFSFLPAELTYLIGTGIVIAILLRIFKR